MHAVFRQLELGDSVNMRFGADDVFSFMTSSTSDVCHSYNKVFIVDVASSAAVCVGVVSCVVGGVVVVDGYVASVGRGMYCRCGMIFGFVSSSRACVGMLCRKVINIVRGIMQKRVLAGGVRCIVEVSLLDTSSCIMAVAGILYVGVVGIVAYSGFNVVDDVLNGV